MTRTLANRRVAKSGFAALVAAFVNVAKVFGLPDGAAPRLSAFLSLAAFAVVVSLKIFRPEVDLAGVDALAADLAVAVLYVLGFLVQMGLPAYIHEFLKSGNAPLWVSHSKGNG